MTDDDLVPALRQKGVDIGLDIAPITRLNPLQT